MTASHLASLRQVTDVTSPDFRCYDSQTDPTASTITVAAGAQLGIMSDGTIYHPGVVNVYMAKAPSGDAATFDGSGTVWFKVYQISAVTDGGTSISWPAQNLPGVTFTLPKNLPTGQYLVRMEAIALHVASTYGGAQFYVSGIRLWWILLTCAHGVTPLDSSRAVRSTSRAGAAAVLAPSSPFLACTPATCVPRFPRLCRTFTLCSPSQEPGILININVSLSR